MASSARLEQVRQWQDDILGVVIVEHQVVERSPLSVEAALVGEELESARWAHGAAAERRVFSPELEAVEFLVSFPAVSVVSRIEEISTAAEVRLDREKVFEVWHSQVSEIGVTRDHGGFERGAHRPAKVPGTLDDQAPILSGHLNAIVLVSRLVVVEVEPALELKVHLHSWNVAPVPLAVQDLHLYGHVLRAEELADHGHNSERVLNSVSDDIPLDHVWIFLVGQD